MKKLITLLLVVHTLIAGAQWTKVAPIPTGPTTGCFNWVIGNRVFVSGGNASTLLWEYDVAKDTWISKGNMGGNVFHTMGMSFVANGKGYILGGDTAGANSTSASVWEYDPGSNQWSFKCSFPGGKRKSGACFTIGNKVYIGGGEDGVTLKDDFYSYEPATGKWQNLGKLPLGQANGMSSFVLNGKGYVCTGEIWVVSQGVREGRGHVWEFDPANGLWKQKKDMQEDRVFASSFSMGGTGYIIGGTYNFATSTKTVWKYDAVKDEWIKGDEYPDAHTLFATAWTIDGAYFFGAGANIGGGGVSPSDAFYRYGKPTGINQVPIAAGNISVYPNPASTNITVCLPKHMVSGRITITDMSGRKVLTAEAINSMTPIDLGKNKLSTGTYILRVDNEQHHYSSSFQVQ